jgi:hypothetical protein
LVIQVGDAALQAEAVLSSWIDFAVVAGAATPAIRLEGGAWYPGIEARLTTGFRSRDGKRSSPIAE